MVTMADASDMLRWGYNAYNTGKAAGYGSLRGSTRVPYKKRYPKYRRYSSRGLLTRMPTHNYIRRLSPTQIIVTQSTGVTTVGSTSLASPGFGMAMQFTLANTIIKTGGQTISISNNYSDFTNLYDMYKITGIRVQLFWSDNFVYPGNAYTIPLLQTAVDNDNATPPASNNELTQYSTFKIANLAKPYSRSFKPTVSVSLTQPTGGAGGSGSAVASPWLSTDSIDTAHSGLKLYFDNYNSSANINSGQIAMYITMYISCKGSK